MPTASAHDPPSLLRDDVYVRLRDDIVDGTLEPGEQLRDGELAAWPGVSRTPIREALLQLQQAGLVVTPPTRRCAGCWSSSLRHSVGWIATSSRC